MTAKIRSQVPINMNGAIGLIVSYNIPPILKKLNMPIYPNNE